jgi:hypothetical protein
MAEPLRLARLPVLGRIYEGRLMLDLIAVPPDDDADLTAMVLRLER